jgi:transposase-like protein
MSPNKRERAAMAERRRFTAGEKPRILEEADACTGPGEIGALLRREDIPSSYLSRWRVARDRGQLSALGGQTPGPESPSEAALRRQVTRLQRENARLQARLEQAAAILEAPEGLSHLLGPSSPETERPKDGDRGSGRARAEGGHLEGMSCSGRPPEQLVPGADAFPDQPGAAGAGRKGRRAGVTMGARPSFMLSGDWASTRDARAQD